MKTMQLNQVLPGGRFVLDGVAFVKLDEEDGVAFALTAAAELRRVQFDSRRRKDRNKFSGSNVEAEILAWLDSHPGIGESVVERPIDLTSMDGLRDYGAPLVRARILTIDEYRRYRSLFPLTAEPYWTATPWTTESSPYSVSNSAYYVYSDGTVYRNYVIYPYFAARPALYLKSDIFVSAE